MLGKKFRQKYGATFFFLACFIFGWLVLAKACEVIL